MSAYIQKISDGTIAFSCSSQTVENPKHLATLQEFVTSRGHSLSDYAIADATQNEISAMIEAVKTPLEVWVRDMRGLDNTERMSREMEEHITEGHDGFAGTPERQARYDRKKQKRSEKPA